MDKKIIFNNIDKKWLNILDNEELYVILEKIYSVKADNKIVPKQENIFEFARLTDINNIKIVILGQDPYPKYGDAHGLAFSCLTKIPSSLKNIYKCLVNKGNIKNYPNTGDLTPWAKQGVLLLNCALTTISSRPREHIKLWESYTDNLIEKISNIKLNGKYRPIFMLWGNYAKGKKYLINKKCSILEFSHPSPLAQQKENFINCDHFTIANNILKNKNLEMIDWTVSEIEYKFDIDDKTCVVFTDGSCFPNRECPESVAGYASCFSLGLYKDTILYGSIKNRPYYATNNRAEGLAIYKTILFLYEHIDTWNKLVIVTDSNFWINMFEEYMPMWERKKINFAEKKNSDMTIPMYKLYKEITIDCGKIIEFKHIRSHNKDNWLSYGENTYEYFCAYNNDYVDKMANYARKKKRPGEDVIELVEYNG